MIANRLRFWLRQRNTLTARATAKLLSVGECVRKKMREFRLQGVIASVNYADFLAYTLPMNRCIFDRLIVVTDTFDFATQKLCEYYHVECVNTDAFHRDGAKFNKGAGLNEGFKRLGGDGWIVHLDSDIVLPARTREILTTLSLDKDTIYGIDRLMCPSYYSWLKFLENPEIQAGKRGFMGLGAFPLGARLLDLPSHGYLPIGFFQLWHSSSGILDYAEHEDGADHTDIVQVKRFKNKGFIPEIAAIHLQSGEDKFGANWNGRTTKKFGY